MQSATKSTQAVASSGAAAGTAVALVNMSSPVAIWAILNQMQLFLLLTLIQCGLPKDVEDYILGNKMASLSFDFFPVEEKTRSDTMLNWFDVAQTHEYLEKVGVKYGSTFRNNFSLLGMFMVVGVLHLLILLSPK